jgi:outer membrane protein OmpA-like peptidoglycan-associated protein
MTSCKTKILMLTALALAGSVGVARAEVNDRDVVHDTKGQVVHISNGTCVRTKWDTGLDACASRRFAQQTVVEERKARSVAEFTREERTVYFEFDRFALSSDALARLDTLANALKTDQSVKEARIVGYADRIGSIPYNDRLSQKRAETVRDYLIAKGYTNAHVTETRWVGKSKPSTNCPAAQDRSNLIACLQNDRRVEVEIVLLNKGQKPNAR